MNHTTWGREGRMLNVFISSPDDVRQERRIVHEVLLDVNRSMGNRLGITLQSRMWENFTPSAGDPMEFIRGQLIDCDLFVLIFSRRFGSAVRSTNGEYESGTEQEFDLALELREKQGGRKPQIHAFFKNVVDEETLRDPGPELKKVLDFKSRVQQTLFYKEYSSEEAFRPLVKDCVIEWLWDAMASLSTDAIRENKQATLQRFFDLGCIQGKSPAARIIYPPLSAEDLPARQDITHLLPYMVLEDFQAINKLTKNLSLAGYDDIKAVTEDVCRQRVHDTYVNKIFLCLPRNKMANDHLSKIKEARFEIESGTESIDGGKTRRVSQIKWKSDGNTTVTVRSPQSRYLLFQRKKKQPRRTWIERAGEHIAVDFAVLAKFQDTFVDDLAQASGLKVYFIFGIRGLGTWGATWYLDHQYEDMKRHMKSGTSHQQLLRVEYRNHRIFGVEDVSSKSQEYFDQQCDNDYIRGAIGNERE